MLKLPEKWSAAFVDGLADMASFHQKLDHWSSLQSMQRNGSLHELLKRSFRFHSFKYPSCTLKAEMVSSLQADAQQIADEIGPLKDGEAEKFLRNHPLQNVFE